jgi:hypothetical protein
LGNDFNTPITQRVRDSCGTHGVTEIRAAQKHRQATLRALAFKWIRILWRCRQDRIPYDDARYLASLQRQKSPLATRLAIT